MLVYLIDITKEPFNGRIAYADFFENGLIETGRTTLINYVRLTIDGGVRAKHQALRKSAFFFGIHAVLGRVT